MGMLNVYVIMALLGFVAFVFIAESLNPFRRHIIESLKIRHRVGAIAGLLIALSSLINLVVPAGSLLSQVKMSLAASFFLLLPLVLFMLVKQLTSNRQVVKKHSQPTRRAAQLNLANQHARKTTSKTTAGVATTTASPTTASVSSDSSSLLGADGKSSKESISTNTVSAEPVANRVFSSQDHIEKDNIETHRQGVTGEQDSASLELDNTLDERDEIELQRSLTDQAPTPDLDDLTIGNSFPFTARVADDTRHAANAEFMQESSNTFPAPETHDSSIIADDLVDDIVEWHAVEDDKTESVDSVEVTDTVSEPANDVSGYDNTQSDNSGRNQDEISRLEAAMDSVTHQADAIQSSITRIQDLNAEEGRYREQLQHAQIAYDNALKLQIEQQRKLIDNGEQQLANESKQRNDAENELARKRREFVDMQVRVKDLETELSERQHVFADQVSSLKKTREMARHAAHLARRAALAQQRARAQALQERAAREKLEVSAKKAVNIARNAISKLAEEERKNRQITH